MLDLLYKYAQDHNLCPEPGFAAKDIRWALDFSTEGRFLGVVELGDVSRKKNPGWRFPKCPEFSFSEMKARGVIKSHFLCEASSVVSLYKLKADDTKIKVKHRYFLDLLRQAALVMPELAPIARELEKPETLTAIQERLGANKAKPTEKVTFRIAGTFPVESADWHDWWRAFRQKVGADKFRKTRKKTGLPPQIMYCFASGEPVEPVPVHPQLSGLLDVGGAKSKDRLINFKQESFQSYGLKQSLNAAVSEQAANAYRDALDDLINRSSQQLVGAKVVHWFKKKVSLEDDLFHFLEVPEEETELAAQNKARELLLAISDGKRPDLADNQYYALTISGAAGRVMVRDWMVGSFEGLVRSVNSWFADLSIINWNSSNMAKLPRIERVITCLLPPRKPTQKYGDWIKPIGTHRLAIWMAAVQNQVFPSNILSRLVLLTRDFHVNAKLEEALDPKNKRIFPETISLLHVRMGLIKAFHLRQNRQKGGLSMDETLKPYLNPEHPHPAYHCGRLMAVFAALQHRALGDVGAGVVQRYYAAASSTPALVLGRLARTSQFHLNKLEAGLAHWFENRMAAIWGRIKDGLPKTLTLEEQSLFALGYYQEMADLRHYRKDDAENNQGVEHE